AQLDSTRDVDLVEPNPCFIERGDGMGDVLERHRLMTHVEAQADVRADGVEAPALASRRPESAREEFDGGGRRVEPTARLRLETNANRAAAVGANSLQFIGRGNP